MLWKAWRFESKLRKLAGNFNGGLWPAVEVSIGELIANACTDACQESLRRLFHRYTPIQMCVCVRIYTYTSVWFVIVGGLIKARIERNAASIFMRIMVLCRIVRRRVRVWIDGTRAQPMMTSFKDRCTIIILRRVWSPGFIRLAHACTPCYGLCVLRVVDEE